MSEFQKVGQENVGNMELGKILPGEAEIPEPVKLNEEENQGLVDILTQAKEAEKAGDIENATKLYTQYRDEYQNLRTEKLGGELGEKLNLHEQYESQIKILTETGILQELSDGSQGIIGIDNKEYPVPSFEDIRAKITPEKAEMLKKKIEQGFGKMLLVPFGMPVDTLKNQYKDLLLQKDSEGTLLATDGSKLQLDRNEPFAIWYSLSREIIYFPEEFSLNHNGKTKQDILAEAFLADRSLGGGWKIEFIEDTPDMPENEQDMGGRTKPAPGKKPSKYLEIMQNDKNMSGEHGFTFEIWLTYAMTNLKEKNQQIDDLRGQGKSSWLTGIYQENSGCVPNAYWGRGGRKASFSGGAPSDYDSNSGFRSSVEI